MIIQHEGTWYLECPVEEAEYAKVGQWLFYRFQGELWVRPTMASKFATTDIKELGATFFKLLPMPGEGEWQFATEEDRLGRKPKGAKWWHNALGKWCESQDDIWGNGLVYVVPVYCPDCKDCGPCREAGECVGCALPKPAQPEVPEGYRLATEEDRKHPRPKPSYWRMGNEWVKVYLTGWHEGDIAIPLPSQPGKQYVPSNARERRLAQAWGRMKPYISRIEKELDSIWTQGGDDLEPEVLPSTGLYIPPEDLERLSKSAVPFRREFDGDETQEEPEAGSTEGSTKDEFNPTCGVAFVQRFSFMDHVIERFIKLPDSLPQATQVEWRLPGEPWPTEVEAEVFDENHDSLVHNGELRIRFKFKKGEMWDLANRDKVYIRRAP